MHSMLWASRPGGAYFLPGQATVDVLQLEVLSWSEPYSY